MSRLSPSFNSSFSSLQTPVEMDPEQEQDEACDSSSTPEKSNTTKSNNNKMAPDVPSSSCSNQKTKESSSSASPSSEQQQQQQEQRDDAGDATSIASSSASSTSKSSRHNRYALFCTLLLIFVIGFSSAAAFLSIGIASAQQAADDYFEKSATWLIMRVKSAWRDYENAASFIHKTCRTRKVTRQEYRDLYEYLVAGGLEFQVAHYVPNVSHDERAWFEEEAKTFYEANYPAVNYTGFKGFDAAGKIESPRREMPWYMPIQWSEPVAGSEAAQGLDINDEGLRTKEINYSMTTGLPSLTGRIRLVQEKTQNRDNYAVALLHPGVNLSSSTDVWPRDLANVVVRIPDLLRRASGIMEQQTESSEVYLFDRRGQDDSETFLGAVKVHITKQQESSSRDECDASNQTSTTSKPERIATVSTVNELSKAQLLQQIGTRRYQQEIVPIANKQWCVVVVAAAGTYEDDVQFVMAGGVLIVLASAGLAWWVYTDNCRVARDNARKAEVEAEKAALILDSAKKATNAERELNDFLAHEVRNPISAAMAACSFVKTALQKEETLHVVETMETVQDDVNTIEYSLSFVSDLLRNMLDMHRATNKKLEVTMTPVDVFTDVLEPCASMLTQRGGNLEVTTRCPPSLIVTSDRLRLKQVVLNLGRNSAKFCEDGFIRLSADIVDGHVQLAVCDSGPGIPLEKRNKLFVKYQESLDALCQGTGIGLFLCEKLTGLLGGEIHLDEDYDSGLPGRPGCRFVIDLKAPPVDVESMNFGDTNDMVGAEISTRDSSSTGDVTATTLSTAEEELPLKLSVLFVDDDMILRKLFKRTIQTVAPTWVIREAASGESAVKMAVQDGIAFDLIFIDQYMSSVEKQMLGTETVQKLRQNGIDCRLCGLSANDKEKEFLSAGADAFTTKPFPCAAEPLKRELKRILFGSKWGETL